MKKIIFFGAVILLAALFVGQAQAAISLPLGTNFKEAGKSAVYYYGNDGTKHLYPDMATLLSWYPDKKFNIKTVTKKLFDSIPAGGNSMFKAGTIVKFGRLASVYKSLKYGELCYATSANFADKNFGLGWRQKIMNAVARFSSYKITGPCPEESDLPTACDVSDPDATEVNVGGLRLNTYVKYVGPFTEAQKTEMDSSLNGITNVSSFRAWTFSNQTPGSSTVSGEYIKIAAALRLSFSNEADLEAAKIKLTTVASGTAAMPTVAPEMTDLKYQPCQVAGREGECLLVDPSVLSDKLQEVCRGQDVNSTNTLEKFGYSLVCSGLLFPAQMVFVYSDNLDLSVVMRINMLNMGGNAFISTSTQGTTTFTYPDGFIMYPGQQDELLTPYLDYLNQCKAPAPAAENE